ncbi:MAG TPA: class I tRNA ligase family protein [Streptosporangiaceae bacterium]|nr:class I tRNA ligase family protein [Streptosporangiaceae bacterium]
MPRPAGARAGQLRPSRDVRATIDLPSAEREMLSRWTAHGTPARSLARTADRSAWVCYDGPATAHGMPGIQHLPGRVIADIYPRFKAMRGFQVARQAGWDCHGLPVEVAVEKELGLCGPADIQAYGVDRFIARCRESALRHVVAFADLAERMGCWVDLASAFRTMDPGYIEYVWWSVRQLFDAGLLFRDYRIGPYCPRCQTPLSPQEAGPADGGSSQPGQAVTVRFPLLTVPAGAGSQLHGADLLAWTTKPWTLPSCTGIALHPDTSYAVARRAGHGDRVVLAEEAFARVLGEGWHIAARLPGRDLAGATCRPVFGTGEHGSPRRVVTEPFVRGDVGTGLVQLTPAYGTADLAAARSHDLPVVNPLGPDGRFDPTLPLVGGVFFLDAVPVLVASLADRGLLFSAHTKNEAGAHCWRCGTPLLPYPVRSWYVRGMTAGSADLALSRTRYWGTPMPLWECGHGHLTCAGSLAELSRLADRDVTGIDPHRPEVDRIVIGCPDCGAAARRVPEIIDASFDAGAMPFARRHGPARGETAPRDRDPGRLPAQFLAEDSQQARSWRSSLQAVGRLVLDRPTFVTGLRAASVADGRGRPMRGRLGNVIQPRPVIERYGADAVRWLVAATSSRPVVTLSDDALRQVVRKVLLTYWNAAAFLLRYSDAPAAGGRRKPGGPGAPAARDRPPLDRWLLGEMNTLIGEVTTALDSFRSDLAARRIAAFVGDVSNWYLRLSRSRFRPGPVLPGHVNAGSTAAFATLHECLETLTRLMAPIAPFLADHVWGLLRSPAAPDSVHHASWPQAAPDLIDRRLAGQMTLVRRLARLGHAARADAMIKVRQPLSAALVAAPGFADLGSELRSLLADEINVRALRELAPASGDSTRGRRSAVGRDAVATVALDLTITPELRSEGLAREVVRMIQRARKSDAFDDGDQLALRWHTADAGLAAALAEHRPAISAQTRAPDFGPGQANEIPQPDIRSHVNAQLGLTVWLWRISS